MNVITAFAPNGSIAEARLARLKRGLEWPMAVLALAVIPILVIEGRAASETWRSASSQPLLNPEQIGISFFGGGRE